ncbi:hypothetical protein N9L68_05785 [bacterium]|nr:hypothetical protein [bacterium]
MGTGAGAADGRLSPAAPRAHSAPQVAALQNGARDADVPHHGDGDDQSVKASLKVFKVVPPRATHRNSIVCPTCEVGVCRACRSRCESCSIEECNECGITHDSRCATRRRGGEGNDDSSVLRVLTLDERGTRW